SQKFSIGEACVLAKSDNNEIHRGNHNEPLISRADRSDGVRGRIAAEASGAPLLLPPVALEHIFDIEFARVWPRRAVIPKAHAKGRICRGATQTLRKRALAHDRCPAT